MNTAITNRITAANDKAQYDEYAKQLIAQKQSKITDRQFFTSRILANHFADIAAAQTRRYGYRRRIKVQIIWKPKDPRQASTDNNNILILINDI